jgi:hypothetical protein
LLRESTQNGACKKALSTRPCLASVFALQVTPDRYHPSGFAFGFDPTGRCHKREFLLIEKVKKALGFRAKGRRIKSSDDTFELREGQVPYGAADKLDSGNTFLWNERH